MQLNAAAGPADGGDDDLVAVARAGGSLDTLALALDAAGLTERLRDGGPYTLFAPTNEAFARLPDGVLEALLRPENRDRLTVILLSHVVPGELLVADLADAKTVETLQGSPARIEVDAGRIRIGPATVIRTEIAGRSGVIHYIDEVMGPMS